MIFNHFHLIQLKYHTAVFTIMLAVSLVVFGGCSPAHWRVGLFVPA